MVSVENWQPSSLAGMTAAWAGSIALHASVILGLHWVALPLAPDSDGPPALQVAVIESVDISPPGMPSGGVTGGPEPRVVTRPPARTETLLAPVRRARAPEITTTQVSPAEVRTALRLQARPVLPKKVLRPSVRAAQRVESVQPDVTPSRPPAARHALATVRRGSSSVASVEAPQVRSVASVSALDTVKDLDAGPRSLPHFSKSEPTRTVAASEPVTVRRGARAARRPSARTRPSDGPAVVQAVPRAREGHVIDQAAVSVQAASPFASGSWTRAEEKAGTRMRQSMQTQVDSLVNRRTPKVAGLPLQQQSRVSPAAVVSNYGWLAQAVHRRIAELKRYPHAARLNQWEGRVVLRAVIREDGQLAALSVRKSSGHHELDEDAMELVRQICPVPLQHPLGRPDITMHIPITYTLDR